MSVGLVNTLEVPFVKMLNWGLDLGERELMKRRWGENRNILPPFLLLREKNPCF